MENRELVQMMENRETPVYFYDMALLADTLDKAIASAGQYGYRLHYAMKANHNGKILQTMSSRGVGADCVSGNEVKAALENGFLPGDIVFAGVGKTDREIKFALETGIFAFNCESLQEVEIINQMAEEMGVRAGIFLRLNPDIDAYTHDKITTGRAENKFGLPMGQMQSFLHRRKDFNNIEWLGLHFHIGSQITDMVVFENLCQRINKIQDLLEDSGILLPHLNVGGGLGIDYENLETGRITDFESYFETFHRNLKLRAGQQLHFEPGRSLVAQSGILLSRVLFTKAGLEKQFVIIDASMTDLLRPALYGAVHKIENLSRQEGNSTVYEVAGPVCESSDVFAKNVVLPQTGRGDILAIYSTGAYGQVMSSTYNMRNPAETVYSDEIKVAVKKAG